MRKNIFICIIFAVSISACTNELDKEINIETNSSLYDLSESEALTIAKTFHESVTSEPRTRDNNTAFGIKSTYRLHASEKTRALSSEKLPLIYEIEINNGPKNGRIIVSGDKRFQKVLAYIPSFNDSVYQVSLGPHNDANGQKYFNGKNSKLQRYIINTFSSSRVYTWGSKRNDCIILQNKLASIYSI